MVHRKLEITSTDIKFKVGNKKKTVKGDMASVSEIISSLRTGQDFIVENLESSARPQRGEYYLCLGEPDGSFCVVYKALNGDVTVFGPCAILDIVQVLECVVLSRDSTMPLRVIGSHRNSPKNNLRVEDLGYEIRFTENGEDIRMSEHNKDKYSKGNVYALCMACLVEKTQTMSQIHKNIKGIPFVVFKCNGNMTTEYQVVKVGTEKVLFSI